MSNRFVNPHSAYTLLSHRPKDAKQLVLSKNPSDAWKSVQEKAVQNKVAVAIKTPSRTESGVSREGSYLEGSLPKSIAHEILFKKNLIVYLDCVQDPQNLGAIFRVASFFGVDGIVFPKDRSANVSGIVYDVSAGGAEVVPHAVVSNGARFLEEAKENGFWVATTSEHGGESIKSIPKEKMVLVFGNEEVGVRPLIEKTADYKVCIPSFGHVTSLNVASAVAVVLSSIKLG